MTDRHYPRSFGSYSREKKKSTAYSFANTPLKAAQAPLATARTIQCCCC